MGRAKRALKWLKKRLFGTKNHKKANTMTNPNKGKSSGSGWKNISDEDTDAWQLPDCLLPSESYTTIDIGESLYSTPSTIRRVYGEMPISPPHSVGSISSFSVLVMERHGNPEETGTAHASIKPFILITSPSGNVSFEVQMTCPSTVRLSHFSTKMTSPSTESLACKLEEKLKNVTLRQSAQLAMIKTHIATQLKRGETVRAKKLDAEECRMKIMQRNTEDRMARAISNRNHHLEMIKRNIRQKARVVRERKNMSCDEASIQVARMAEERGIPPTPSCAGHDTPLPPTAEHSKIGEYCIKLNLGEQVEPIVLPNLLSTKGQGSKSSSGTGFRKSQRSLSLNMKIELITGEGSDILADEINFKIEVVAIKN